MTDAYTPPTPSYDDVAPEERAAFDRILDRTGAMADRDGFGSTPERGSNNAFVSTLLNSPVIGYHYFELGVYYRSRGEFPDSYGHADREWVDMVLATDLDCPTIMWAHLPDAVATGVRPAAVKALREGRLDDLTPEERELTDIIRAVRAGTFVREQFERLAERFGTRGAIDYIGFICHILMTIPMYKAFDADSRPASEVDALVEELVAGTYDLPHPKARVPLPETVLSFDLKPIKRREL